MHEILFLALAFASAIRDNISWTFFLWFAEASGPNEAILANSSSISDGTKITFCHITNQFPDANCPDVAPRL
jgi:hypothetical protein